MAIDDTRPYVPILPSLWDRLFDNRPIPPWERIESDSASASRKLRFHDLQELKRCVARDIEILLNTRREQVRAKNKAIGGELPEQYHEARRSVMTYGLPDFTTYSIRQDQKRIQRAIQLAIATHEPRLRHPSVKVHDPGPTDRVLRFRVDAILRVESARERVAFDAVMQLSTQRYEVKEL